MTSTAKSRPIKNVGDGQAESALLLLEMLARSGCLTVSAFSSDEVADLLLAAGGTAKTFVYLDNETAIENVTVEVGPLTLECSRPSRTATPEEVAAERARQAPRVTHIKLPVGGMS